MIDKLISFSIKNKMIIGLFTIALIIWGGYSLTQLPIDAVPDITNNQVQVITLAPTLSTQETERFITYPMEVAMASLPDKVEIRSISRFGLSVITIVFKDDVNMYLARQLVSERMNAGASQIPAGLGTPELGPISTGLGEIYNYVVRAKAGYEKKYSATDLRTIQDWLIKRQLVGTPGVAEVSGWGGEVKQYEIAVSPDELNSKQISLSEIFAALQNNNENTGGAYIEKQSNAYFIRGLGLISSQEDIKKIVVKTVNGIPILIRDIAEVNFGSAIRYGAVTRNGEGEVVGAVVLMLRGENSAKVIGDVKEKIVQIQKSLPEGVVIEPYLDRTKLITKTTSTVSRNLLEGALIVIFVLLLLVGQFRAGLIIASVIPLAMLFAVSMMNLFGISGNLMSLGAIDFGLIVDGTVIIVEAVLFRLHVTKQSSEKSILTQAEMDDMVYKAASPIRSAAAFGEIIILIVYIPILTLVGIEGKMFRPMAETVGFAITGALILSMTYVPMISAVALSKSTLHKRNISDKIMDFFHRIYHPVIEFALKRKFLIISAAVILFTFSLFVFSRMGGEFIPTLEEGDLVVEFGMMQGTSLSETIKMTTRAEKVLKQKFPEVLTVVSRIGTSEIPTDPIPMERADILVALKDKSEWTSADTREDLMEKMEEALRESLPGSMFEINQPIQMRFNELIAGSRQDVVIKIYGDDLEVLYSKANEISKLISGIQGVGQPIVERIAGLPQITVEYNRDKIAEYGLSISDVNSVLKTAFAGETAGVVFEGEKKFDLVVRLAKNYRNDIENIKSLFIPLSSGKQIPISELADIQFKEGPAQITRDNTHRRIAVGFNSRGSDVQTIVAEIQAKLNTQLKLPAGYYLAYGGQFENLAAAKKRLSIAVPLALLLIFILLYFTFRSFKQGLLIYTAIPLSAIGGVLALYLRGMPFSISAGVGFIALFGVAVLNGIVLISEFNRLKADGISDIYERVRLGTKHRMRPVIITASVAALGFLPMAISTQAGAEVQKPLATVVIGGLITATLLTLVVLPVLYILFSGKKRPTLNGDEGIKPLNTTASIIIFLIASFFISQKTFAQENKPLTLDDCIKTALQNNPQIKSSSLKVKQQESLKKTSFDLPKTVVSLQNVQNNYHGVDSRVSITQNVLFPTVYFMQNKVQQQNVEVSEKNLIAAQSELIKNVKTAYYQLAFGLSKLRLLTFQDSIYKNFYEFAELKYKTGETSYLEKLTSQNKYQEIQVFKKQAQADVSIFQQELQKLLVIQYPVLITDKGTPKLSISLNTDTSAISQNPLLAYYNQNILLANSKISLEKNKFLPDLSAGYIIQREYDVKGLRGYQFGIGIPIFFWGQQGRIQSAKIQSQIAQSDYENYQNNLKTLFNQQLQEYEKYSLLVNYYENTGLKQGEEILKVSQLAYNKGEIGYVEYIQNLTQAISIKSGYLSNLNQFNQTVITISYLTGK